MRRRVSILGLGLIGGSIGLALGASRETSYSITGYDPDRVACDAARELGAVDLTATTVEDAVEGADIAFLAAPVSALPNLLEEVVAVAPARAVISDVGSTKGEICRVAETLGARGQRFVGGHPLSGSERSGVRAADPYLFQNVPYVLTPTASGDADALTLLTSLVSDMGAQPLVLAPEDHDVAVAAVSHLPHLAAGALVNAVLPMSDTHPEVLQLAAGGFRDTTRVASGDPALWRDICMSNRRSIGSLLSELRRELAEAEDALAAGDAVRVQHFLERARRVRERLPKRPKGIKLEPAALIVRLSDRPGSLAEVTQVLANRDVNIIDAEILRVREGEGGTLRLGFERPGVSRQAAHALTAAGYAVHPV